MTTDAAVTSNANAGGSSTAAGSNTTMPMAIRRAGPEDHRNVQRSTLSQTPGGVNFYGSTPGGTKLMYSREQLLALSSSPLARSPAQGLSAIPASISRSPEKSADFHKYKGGSAAGGAGGGLGVPGGAGGFGGGSGSGGSEAQKAVFGGGSAVNGASKAENGVAGGGRGAQGGAGDEQFTMDL